MHREMMAGRIRGKIESGEVFLSARVRLSRLQTAPGRGGSIARVIVMLDHTVIVHEDNHLLVVSKPAKGGREALLKYRILKQTKTSSLIEIDQKTGRYHQIRAQRAYIGYLRLGDGKYGANRQPGLGESIGLHSYAVLFTHPVGNQTLHLTAPYPTSSATFTAAL